MGRRARVLSHQVEALEYRHADDGLPYRHEFERGDSDALLLADGSVRIRNRGTALWDTFDVDGHRQPFLVNPRGRRETMATKKKRRPRLRKGSKEAKAFMASIRPGAKKARRKSRRSAALTRSEGQSMATSRKRRRANTALRRIRKRHPVVKYRRRRNPPAALSMNRLITRATDGAINAGLIIGGKIGVRQARRLAKQEAGSVVGYAVELGTALAIGLFGPMVLGERAAGMLMAGGFAATGETLLKGLAIPYVSDALGNAGMYDVETLMLPADRAATLLEGYSAPSPASLNHGYTSNTNGGYSGYAPPSIALRQ